MIHVVFIYLKENEINKAEIQKMWGTIGKSGTFPIIKIDNFSNPNDKHGKRKIFLS